MNLSLTEATRLVWMIRENDWLGVRNLSMHMLRAGSDGLLRKYKDAVRRTETHFRESFQQPAWSPDWSDDRILDHRRMIAWLCRGFGSAGPLIADITAARKDGKRPLSLVWFMISDKGKRASRWDLLLGAKREREWEDQKAEENQIAHDMKRKVKPLANSMQLVQNELLIKGGVADYKAALADGKRLRRRRSAARYIITPAPTWHHINEERTLATKRKKPEIPIPTIEEVGEYLLEIKTISERDNILEARCESIITRAKARYKAPRKFIADRIKELSKSIYRYLDVYKDKFVKGGSVKKRSVQLQHGVIGWRKIREDKFKVSSMEAAVACCEELELKHLISTEKSVNQKALALHLKSHPEDLDRIDGISRPDQDDESYFDIIQDSDGEVV